MELTHIISLRRFIFRLSSVYIEMQFVLSLESDALGSYSVTDEVEEIPNTLLIHCKMLGLHRTMPSMCLHMHK